MKRSGNNAQIIKSDGKTIGVSLPADYKAQHEMGIGPLLSSLSINENGIFLAGRSMSSMLPKIYKLIEYEQNNDYFETKLRTKKKIIIADNAVALIRNDDFRDGITVAKELARRYRIDADITGAWDESEFLVVGWTDAGKQAVNLISEGIKTGDIAIWTRSPYLNGVDDPGLNIVRPSLVSDEQREIIRQHDQAIIDLASAVEATGIVARLAETNKTETDTKNKTHPHARLIFHEQRKGYHALEPRALSIKQMAERNTIHNVLFFLNPHDQSTNQFGWYTVEELDLWINGHGPVIEKKLKVAKQP